MRITKFLAIGLIAVLPAAALMIAAPAYGSDTSTQVPTKTKTLARTFSAKQVERLQMELAKSGHEVAIDGIWGKKTAEALRAFQKEHGLKVTGFVNAATAKALPKID